MQMGILLCYTTIVFSILAMCIGVNYYYGQGGPKSVTDASAASRSGLVYTGWVPGYSFGLLITGWILALAAVIFAMLPTDAAGTTTGTAAEATTTSSSGPKTAATIPAANATVAATPAATATSEMASPEGVVVDVPPQRKCEECQSADAVVRCEACATGGGRATITGKDVAYCQKCDAAAHSIKVMQKHVRHPIASV